MGAMPTFVGMFEMVRLNSMHDYMPTQGRGHGTQLHAVTPKNLRDARVAENCG